MTIQHSIITDPNIHEIKGASTAIIRTSPVSDGAGGTTWQHNLGSVHGEIYLTTASVSVGPTGGTITNDADYRVIGPTWTLNPDTYNTQLHSSNQAIQALIKGHYLFSAYVSFATGAVASGTNYALKFRINGSATLSTRRLVTQKVTAGVDRLFISGTALLMLNANDYVDLMLASSVADTAIISDAGITLALMHEVV